MGLFFSTFAAAVAVYDQVPGAASQSGALITSSWLDPNGSDADSYAYDSFILAASAPITEVHWRGGYLHGAMYGRASTFTLTFYESTAGGLEPHVTNPQLPEIFLAQYAVPDNAGETSAGTFGGTLLYDYHFTLPSSFQAAAGVKYWLRIEAAQSGYPDWGLALGTGGDGQHFAFSTGAARFSFGSGDCAFTLLSPPGPFVTLALSSAPAVGGATHGAGAYAVSSSAAVSATANPGYAFINWTENGVPVSSLASDNFTLQTSRSLVANFAPAFAIAASALPAAGGSVSGAGSYPYGSTVTLASVPSASYAFVNWTENGAPVSVAANYGFIASASRALTANFTALGTSTPVYSQPADATSGAIIKSAWMPPNGLDGDQYEFDNFSVATGTDIREIHWRGGYTNDKSGAGKSPVFDFTVSIYPSIAGGSQPDVTAQPLAQYAVGGNAGETAAGSFGGTAMFDYAFVLPTPFHAVAGTKYWLQIEASQGVTPTFGAPPDWGFAVGTGGDAHHFAEIIGGSLAGGNQFFTTTSDLAFTLLAPAAGVSINAVAWPVSGGSAAGGGMFSTGASVTLTAAPSPGWVFVAWNENGLPASASAQYQFTAATDRILVAQFAQQCVITASSSPAAGGTTTGGGTYLSGANVALTATPASGWAFVNWTANGIQAGTSPALYLVASTSQTWVANFVPRYAIATQVSPASSGYASGGGTFSGGGSAMLAATPNPGFAFVGWMENGALVCNRPAHSFLVGANRTLTAQFSAACSITTASSSTNCFATGGGTYPMGASVLAVAVPAPGFSFSNWTENGQVLQAPASYCFTAARDRVLTANFMPDVNSVMFDFDSGSPALIISQATPFDQTAKGLTAHFSSPGAFSIQNDATTGLALSQFSRNYLYPKGSGGVVEIEFSQPVFGLTLSFATLDYQDIVAPSMVRLTAYQKSTNAPAVGTVSGQGDYNPGDPMPMGALTLRGSAPFDLVRIEIPGGLTAFALDNLSVLTVPPLAITRAPGKNVMLSWPAPTSFVLQQGTNIASTNWVAVTSQPAVQGGTNNQATLPVGNGPAFYRLNRP